MRPSVYPLLANCRLVERNTLAPAVVTTLWEGKPERERKERGKNNP